MSDTNPDHLVRSKCKHLLHPSYRPFPFSNLPVELALPILIYATGCSQSTYRSLLLTNKRISDLIRIEHMLSVVSVILNSPHQMEAFLSYITQHPEVIPDIRALWTISPGSVRRIIPTCVSIINLCTDIRSLACHPEVLIQSICSQPFKHKRCISFTMIEFRVTWHTLMSTDEGAQFFNQLEHLHFIGALDQNLWAQWAAIPKLKNLTRASIAMGSHRTVTPQLFEQVIQSPKLKQVVITTRLHGDEQQMLADATLAIDDRFSVMHRRRRWKETNLWHESLLDQNRFWNQAKQEKYLPPAPRPSVGVRDGEIME
ncbi:hypothetical protein B0H15DRAFT_1028093 [Mycena belliarum]|uniref:Uncharacterized protein n=1 Tax=Mycena belliarum TaxID=1033014 RepID=A0AAD6XKJ1_9AGAR|nr:hypothetical protein B0H15DRAFT_1028093 [Mycena belliae]